MKKIIILTAAMLLAIAFTSCTNDKKKGEKDGKAYCDCINDAGEDIVAALGCISYVTDAAKESEEYQESFYKAAADCLVEEE
jgi:hypothetical protein